MVALALVVLGVAVVAPEPRPASEARLGLGVATAKEPVAARIVDAAGWGVAPADQVLVVLKPGSARADADRVAQQLDAAVVGEVAFIGLYQLETQGRTAGDLIASITKARGIDGVALAVADQFLLPDDTLGTRCDPLEDPTYRSEWTSGKFKGYSTSWPSRMIGMGEAWNVIAASGLKFNKVTVGILDEATYGPTGELGGGGVQLTGDTTTTQFTKPDGSLAIGGIGHSTAVAHMGFASAGNGGVVGVAGVLKGSGEVINTDIYRTVPATIPGLTPQLQALRQAQSLAWSMNVMAAAVDQVDRGAKVINMSFGASNTTPEMSAAISGMWRTFLTRMGSDPKTKDVLFVASAGNGGGALDGTNHVPGGLPLPNLVTVGGVDYDGTRSNFSNYAGTGGEVTIAAPANGLTVGIGPDGKPIDGAGTSFAAPQVTGTAALMRALDPTLTAKDVKDILVRTGWRDMEIKAPGSTTAAMQTIDPTLGGRMLRADEAVLEVVNRLLAKQTPPRSLTIEDAQKLATVDLSAAQKDALNWTVTAKVAQTGSGGTDLTFDWQGQGGPAGGSTRHVTGAGSAAWTYIFSDAQGSTGVTVTRADTGACARVSFKAGGAGLAVATPTSTAAPKPAASPAATLRDVVNAARAALGWTGTVALGGSCTTDRCSSSQPMGTTTVPLPGGGVTGFETALTVSVDRAADPAASLDAIRRARTEKGSTGEITVYRGLRTFRWVLPVDPDPPIDPITGRSTYRSRAIVAAAGGAFVFYAETNCSGSSLCRSDVPTRELDAVLNAALAGGLIPAGTLK